MLRSAVLLSALALLCSEIRSFAAEKPSRFAAALETIRAVGPEGRGDREAAKAWRELASADAQALPEVLAGMKGAGPLAANWIRTAVEAIAERELGRGKLAAADLERLVRDRQGDPRARRLAYEWLVRVDPTAPERLLPSMEDDPSLELRRDAVERRLGQAAAAAQANKKDVAAGHYRAALTSARDFDQVERASAGLKKLGQPVDLPRQLGYIVRWRVIGPFDNTSGLGFDKVYPPEEAVRFDATYPGKHGPVRWIEAAATDDRGTIDLNKALVEEKSVVGYATAVVISSQRREVEVRMASYNALKLWVNGKPVAAYPIYHSGFEADQYVNRVELQHGVNRLLVKVCQNDLKADWAKGWFFQLRVCDADGAAVLSDDRQARGHAPERGEGCGFKCATPFAALRDVPPFATPRDVPPFAIRLVRLGAPRAALTDWRQFRGTDSSSCAAGGELPMKNIAWKAQLPSPGPAGPIVVGKQVFVTAATGPKQGRLHVLALNDDGKPLWERRIWATGHLNHSSFGGIAGPTPCSDGRRVFALFSSNDLICFDLDGNLQWLRGLALEERMIRNDVGMASSPLVVGETLIVQLECPGSSFVLGLDAETGENRWRLPRESGSNWVSPTLLPGPAGRDLVLIQSRGQIAAHEPRTGKEVWRFAASCSSISSPAVCGDTVFAPANGGLAALKCRPGKDVEVLWQEQRLRCENASPVVVAGKTYTMKSPAILVCGDATTGKILWQLRLKGTIWSTPVVVGRYLYVISHEGLMQIVELGSEGKLAASVPLSDRALASPAVAGHAVYFRAGDQLWKLSDGQD